MGFRYRFMQFMSGRYGVDRLFYILFIISALISFINIFLRLWFLQLIVYGVMLFAIYRFLSRNHTVRLKENRWVTEKLNFLKRKKDFYNQKKADKYHIYKRCPACKAILRLPRRVGLHTTVCPRCNKEFKVRVRK